MRSGDVQTRSHFVLLTACQQFHLRNGSDGRQRLASEAHGMQREQIVGLTNLRRGMTLESQTGICRRHATAVVNDLNAGTPCIDHRHMDGAGTGINGVLHQFLDDGCRTLNDLTSSYLVCHTVGKKLDNVCHCLRVCLGGSRRVCSFNSVPPSLGRQLKMSCLLSGRI